MLTELVNLLTNGALDADELDEIVEQIAAAPEDPYYDWTGGDDTIAIACELAEALDDFAATSDKIDELHEQIQDMFDDDFPDFPFDQPNAPVELLAYFDWLDAELAQREAGQDRYAAICLDTGADDRLTVFLVYAKDQERVVTLANQLGLRMYRPRDVYAAS